MWTAESLVKELCKVLKAFLRGIITEEDMEVRNAELRKEFEDQKPI